MKFLLFALLIGLAVYALTKRPVRAAIGLFWRKTWIAIVVALLVAITLFVNSYSGDTLRLF